MTGCVWQVAAFTPRSAAVRLSSDSNCIRTRSLIDATKPWLKTELVRISGGSTLGRGDPIRARVLVRAPRFLDDGRIELDNDPGQSRSAARIICSRDPTEERFVGLPCALVATAKLSDVEPFAYLNDVLKRVTHGHPMSQLDDLLPWN